MNGNIDLVRLCFETILTAVVLRRVVLLFFISQDAWGPTVVLFVIVEVHHQQCQTRK